MRRSLFVALLATLIAASLVAQTPARRRSLVPASNASEVNINGQWIAQIVPLLDPNGEGSTQELSIVLMEVDGTVFGRVGFLIFKGIRSGAVIDLEVHHVGEEERDQLGTLRLEIESGQLMSGALVHATMDEATTVAVDHVTFTRKYSSSTTSPLTPGSDAFSQMQGDGLFSDLCGFVAGKVSEKMTRGIAVPFNACTPEKNGGGYYTYGDVGPGPARGYATFTTYVPVEWAACATRRYGFTVRNNGASRWRQVLNFLNTAEGSDIWSKFMPGIHVAELDALAKDVGDFAIALGYSTNTRNVSLYILSPGGHCSSLRNHPVVQAVKNNIPKVFHSINNIEILCGSSEISDPWTLRRSPSLWGSPCNTPVVFVYVIGTIDVRFD